MYLTDYHAHSLLSDDGTVPLAKMAEAAVRAGLSELCITDHCEVLTIEGKPGPAYDWAPALAQFLETREQFRGRLLLRFGVEMGSSQVDDTPLRNAPAQLDFVIGSLHNYSLAAGGLDFYYVKYDSEKPCYDVLDDYVTSMEQLAALPVYDVLGHVLYPLRYMARDGQSVTMDPFMDRLEGIFRTAVQLGRGIELNTYNGRTLADWKPLLALYRAVGGEIITTGADAHRPENVGKGIADAYQLLRDVGFRYITTYERRKPQFIKL